MKGISLLKSIGNGEMLSKIWVSEEGGLEKIWAALGGEANLLKQALGARRPEGDLPNPTSAARPSSSSTASVNAAALVLPGAGQSAATGNGHALPTTVPQKRKMDSGRAVDVDLTLDSD